MKPRIASYGIILALGFGLVNCQALVFAADDAKATPKDIPEKIPDYSKYKFVKELAGELIKSDDKKVTIRVKWSVNAQGNPRLPPPERRCALAALP